MTDNTPFVGNLKFQGSDDGVSYDDLWTIDANIHEGWNTKNWEEGEKPSYNRFRFYSAVAGGCRIGEIEAHGVLAIDDDNDSYDCGVSVFVEDQEYPVNSVNVAASSTPELESISPRFGSVLGGEEVTFTGTGFSDSATITITIDDINCEVSA